MNKTHLINKLKQLEGLTPDEKAGLINLLKTQKKYGLVWEDKPEEVEEQLRQNLPVLTEVVEKRILGKPLPATKAADPTLFDNQLNQKNPVNHSLDNFPNHILIEGDNLHALTALTFTHEGEIDVMYFDPPYNTGNKDFKYNDSFVDKEDSYRHSKWLSFMDKRMRIAKTLLSDKGVFFISIDDNEQAQLKLLCDSIFGENNLIGPIIQNKQNAKNDAINVQKNHEYILIYRKTTLYDAKKKVIPTLINLNLKTKAIIKEGELYYYLNDAITTRADGGILNARTNLGHSIYYHPDTKDMVAVCDYDIELAKTSNDLEKVYHSDYGLISKGYIPIRPPKVRGKLGCWTWSKEKINDEKIGLIVTGKKAAYTVKKRTFVDKFEVYEEEGKLLFNTKDEANSRSILDFSTNDGTDVLNEVLGVSDKFNNPKNLEMLKYFIRLFPQKHIVVLDFFAGSGTTLHAIVELNAEDGGNRQCILVTNNENNICEEVTYERNKRVIQGYTNAKGTPVAGLTNNNLRYFKSEFVPSNKTDRNKRLLTKASTELLCIKEDCYTDVTEANGFLPKLCRLFTNNNGRYLIVVYHNRQQLAVFEQLIEFIKTLDTSTEKVRLYGFSPEKETLVEDFYEVADKIEAVPLPEAIYNAYRATFRILKLDKKLAAVKTTEPTVTEPTLFDNIQAER
jgi:adenine-specific DNA-methyltransferase